MGELRNQIERKSLLRLGSLFLIIAAAALPEAGCGKPFNIKPRTELPPAKFSASGRSGTVEIQAEPVTNEDFLYSVFNANLIMAGLLPVRVRISNTGANPVPLKKARFEVNGPGGTRYKSENGSHAFKRLMSYYKIRAYAKYAYRESREDFISYSLDQKAPLGPNQQRSGFLFFRMPPEMARQTGLSLVVKRIESSGNKRGEIMLKLD